MNSYEKTEAARWKIIVAINPSPKAGEQYYAELSKVNPNGYLYGTKYYKYYRTAEDAFEQMLKFAQDEGLVMTEEQLQSSGFYESYIDTSRMRVMENGEDKEYECRDEKNG